MPIAIACGRVLRARTASERVNACLKAAEVLTRYLAAVALSSFAAREEGSAAKLSELRGNLAFGDFLRTVQEVAASKVQHLAAPLLAQGFKKIKRANESQRGKTDGALVNLLELRNTLGHELRNLDEAKAVAIEANDSPQASLVQALEGVETLLSKPLFIVENQEWTREALVVRRLLLMGESADPTPQFIKIAPQAGLEHKGTPYLAIKELCLPLPPSLLWGIDPSRQNFALLFLDGVDEKRTRYRTMDGNEQFRDDNSGDVIRGLLAGDRRTPETVVLVDGTHLAREWAAIRETIEENGRRREGLIDWTKMDQATMAWYAKMLGDETGDPIAAISDRILDGRTSLDSHELRQLILLFGRKAHVRNEIKRDVLDLRLMDDHAQRPSEREIIESENVLVALRRAVQFFSEKAKIGNLVTENLKSTDGDVDYLTVRETLVNQIVHQDYGDHRTPAQIEVSAKKLSVFNAGYSLVPQEALLDGGKSQSRNPLIARSLRAIGFAEISGSGIRALFRALQMAHRKAPRFDSNRDANTFTLTLDWTEEKSDVDAYWMTLVGARLTAQQAKVLNALAEMPSATVNALETATGIGIPEMSGVLDYLLLQVLIERDESNYRLASQIREKLG